MTEQDAMPESANEPAAKTGNRTNRLALIVVAVVAAVVLVAVGWFAFLSPHDSTVSVVADSANATPGKPLPLAGNVTPAVANRVVEISTARAHSGPYTSAGTAVTDAAGRFAMNWSPTEPGPVWVRASAVTLGRDQQANSSPVALTVRTPATLTLKAGAAAVRTTGNTTVSATLAPAGGTVTFEKSLDGQTWSALEAAPAAKAGEATAKIAGLTGGLWHIRATAAETETATEATAKEVTILVEDYAAAGAKYLSIVAAGNQANTKLNNMIDAGASQAALKKQAEVISKAFTKQAKLFRDYKGWPREVAPVVADMAKQTVIDADNFHLRSQSKSVTEWNEIADSGNAAANAASDDAARIRDILGLPKRNLHP